MGPSWRVEYTSPLGLPQVLSGKMGAGDFITFRAYADTLESAMYSLKYCVRDISSQLTQARRVS